MNKLVTQNLWLLAFLCLPFLAAANVTVTFTMTSNWQNGYCVDVSVNNQSGSTINGWTLSFDTPTQIYNSWNSTYSGSSSAGYSVLPASGYSTIANNTTRTGVGFCVNASMPYNGPTNVRINGNLVSVSLVGFAGVNPTVAWAAPAANANFPSGTSTIGLSVSAADADGTVSSVVFSYNGIQLPAVNTTGTTWTAMMNSPANGTYNITALATDNSGLSTASSRSINVGAITSTAPAYPFPQHTTYTAGTIKPGGYTQAQLDGHVTDFYNQWKNVYLKPGCSAGRYYIESSPNTTISEGIGYGMLIAAYMAGHDPSAKTIFDGLFLHSQDFPSNNNNNLMAWRQENCTSTGGVSSATDGDIDIAYALLLAHDQWGSTGTINYLAEATIMINAIMAADVNPNSAATELGDWVSSGGVHYNASRPIDFITMQFRAFKAATNATAWTSVINKSFDIINYVQTVHAPATGLVPDFVINTHTTTPAPATPNFLEGPNDGNYYYNSCRFPWRMGVDYLVSGDARAKTAANRINNWIKTATGGNAANISNGYQLNGTPIFNWNDPTYVGAFAVGAMVDPAHQSWLNATYNRMVSTSIGNGGGYYGNTLKMLYLITTTCNLWTTQAALPVSLVDFQATAKGEDIALTWKVEQEYELDAYEIEYSQDGKGFQTIGQIKGENQLSFTYNFLDKSKTSGHHYYRLKMVDFDGSYEYSPIVNAEIKKGTAINIFPTVAQDFVYVQSASDTENWQVKAFNSLGQVVYTASMSGTANWEIPTTNWPSGYYHIVCTNEAETASPVTIVKR